MKKHDKAWPASTVWTDVISVHDGNVEMAHLSPTHDSWCNEKDSDEARFTMSNRTRYSLSFDGHGLITKDASSDGNTYRLNKHYKRKWGKDQSLQNYCCLLDSLIGVFTGKYMHVLELYFQIPSHEKKTKWNSCVLGQNCWIQ